ncbi:acyl-CoA dehydrogenase family protein [Zhongshania sp.]|uniref:acyl-CoA dehydrogenase family protein n=1 Tax=Zhongshania sp. TaxID=1971902 RepID=UPI0035615195
MNSEERDLLFASVNKYLTNSYNYYDFRLDGSASSESVMKMYKETCDLGWSAFLFSEEVGGFGGAAIDIAELFEKFGKHRVVTPYLESQITAGTILSCIGEKGSAVLGELIAGNITLCVLGSSDRYSDSGPIALNLDTLDDPACDYGAVPWAPVADKMLVVASNKGEDMLLLVDRQSPSISVERRVGVDGSLVGKVTINDLRRDSCEILAEGSAVSDIVKIACLKTSIALCAEAVGAMESLLRQTVEYTKTRKQFGQPISNFQVLQHMMANMFVAHTTSHEMLKGIASEISTDADYLAYEREIMLLKHKINKESKYVRHSAMQCHGGIATTDELMLGHYLKRLVVIDNYFGGPHVDMDRINREAA